jgi:N-terminal domain of galactosyltransferase
LVRCGDAPDCSGPLEPGDNAQLGSFIWGVVLVPNALFAQVNGYANSYWGWGPEDIDLTNRFKKSGIALGRRRRGTFQPLDHDNRGYNLEGSPTAIALVNQQLHRNRWGLGTNTCMQEDGLQNVAYEILNRSTIPEGPVVERPARWEKVTVRLRMQPPREHLEATTQAASLKPHGVFWTIKP